MNSMIRLITILGLALIAQVAPCAQSNVGLLISTNGAVVGPTNFWNANSNSVFGVLRSTLASKADTNNPTFNGLNIAGGNGLELTFPYGAFSIDATGKISGTVLQNGTVSSNAFDAPTLSMFGVSSGGTLSYDVAIYATTTSTNATAVYTNSIGTNVTHILSLNIVANGYEDYLVSRINCDSNGVVTVQSTNSSLITKRVLAGKVDTNSAIPTIVTYIQGDQYGVVTGRGMYLYETNATGDFVTQFSLEDSTSSTLGPSVYLRGGTVYTNQPIVAMTALSGYGAFKLGSVTTNTHDYTISMRGDNGSIIAGSFTGLNSSLTNAAGKTIPQEIADAVTSVGAVTVEMLNTASNTVQQTSIGYTDAATNALWKINFNLYGNNWSALTNTETSTIEIYLTNSVLAWDGATLTETW